jgi:hypothetical protein
MFHLDEADFALARSIAFRLFVRSIMHERDETDVELNETR